MQAKNWEQRILILCKTYPSPSSKYVETSCVAGMNEQGRLIRLFPVPFRLIRDEQQFKKYQWITARIQKSSDDHRPESHRIYTDTIRSEPPLETANYWEARRPLLDRLKVFDDFAELEAERQRTGITLGLLRPARINSLLITPVSSTEWTDDERAKLMQAQNQGAMFEETEQRDLAQLKKLPFDFHYTYSCSSPEGDRDYNHKIVDWEAGALYWNLHYRHGSAWEPPFRNMIEDRLPKNDLMFLMGTIHRFPDQWLIVSLIYPPRTRPEPKRQGLLF